MKKAFHYSIGSLCLAAALLAFERHKWAFAFSLLGNAMVFFAAELRKEGRLGKMLEFVAIPLLVVAVVLFMRNP
jgi:hypothetical protein